MGLGSLVSLGMAPIQIQTAPAQVLNSDNSGLYGVVGISAGSWNYL